MISDSSIPCAEMEIGRTLLPELRLSFFHGCNKHITDTSIWETVEPCARAVGLNHIEGLGARIVGTVDDRAHGETHRHPELVARATST